MPRRSGLGSAAILDLDFTPQPKSPTPIGARRWVPYNKPRREYGAGLLPMGYAEMEQVGKVLKARYFGPTAEVPLANVTA